jgi:hypothetical protein
MNEPRSIVRLIGAAVIAGALLAAGCGEEPGPEDLLTLVEIDGGGSPFSPGDTAIATRVEITFRDWFNGGAVAEARVSSSLTVAQLEPLLSGDAEARAEAWALVMAASMSAGFAERPMVGYRGLIREPEFVIPVTIPAGGDTAGNPFTSAFVVAYLADVEEVEIEGQPDSLVVMPYGREAGILNDVVAIPFQSGP